MAAAAVVGSAGEHPPLAAFGHVAPGKFNVATKGIEATRTAAPAASAAGTSATTAARPASAARTSATAAARTTRTSPAAAGTTSAAAAAVAIATTATAAPIIAARVITPGFRPRHHVEHVVEIALLLGVGRRVLTRQHAHQAHPSGALARHRECFHQARQAITLNLHRHGHGLSLGPDAKIWRCRFGGWRGRGVTRRLAARFGSALFSRGSGRVGLADALGCGGLGLAFCPRLGASRRRGASRWRGRSLLDLGVCGSINLLCLCCLSQENPGELGDRLHERVLRVMGGPVKEAQMNCLAFRSGLTSSRQWLAIMP